MKAKFIHKINGEDRSNKILCLIAEIQRISFNNNNRENITVVGSMSSVIIIIILMIFLQNINLKYKLSHFKILSSSNKL